MNAKPPGFDIVPWAQNRTPSLKLTPPLAMGTFSVSIFSQVADPLLKVTLDIWIVFWPSAGSWNWLLVTNRVLSSGIKTPAS